jgi:hypothetical protein
MSENPDRASGPQEHALAALLVALRAPAGADELSAQDAYLAAFDAHNATQALRTATPYSRRRPMISTLLATKTAVAAAALATLTVGTAAAAFTGSLPDRLQDVAHHAVGAPAAERAGTATHEPAVRSSSRPTAAASPSAQQGKGPDATGAAREGLCTAFQHGGLATTSTAYRNLAAAAGGAAEVADFCAPWADGSAPASQPSTKPTGRPTDRPSETSTARSTGRPTDQRTGKPTDQPPAKRSGQPSERPTPTG